MIRIVLRPIAVAVLFVAACGPSASDEPPEPPQSQTGEETAPPTRGERDRSRNEPPAESIASQPVEERAGPVREGETSAAPDPDKFLPPLDGYLTREADASELKESLAHSPVPITDIGRWLVLSESGFTLGEVTLVAYSGEPGAAEAYLKHQFGSAEQQPTTIAGTQMHWVRAEPHRVLAWKGKQFVVTFSRGQELGEAWLTGLARATVVAMQGQ